MSCPWNKINIPKQVLTELYKNQRLSIAQIASKFNCTGKPIHRLLREYQIKTRSVSEAKERFFIPKNELKSSYWTQKLSTDQIAQKYGCNSGTILYRMKKYGIKSRGHLGLTKPIKISKEKLEYLYHDRKLSAVKIAKILHRSKGGVERKINNFNIITRNIDNRACKYKKFDFSGNLIEKSYMIGFRLGDLNVVPVKNIIVVRCSTTKKNQIRLIKNLFSQYTTPHFTIAKRGTFEIAVYLNSTFSFLLPKQDNIETWIFEKPEYFWAFLAGYSDAEGYLSLRKEKTKIQSSVLFGINSYDKNILFQLHKGLKEMNINSKPPSIKTLKGTPFGNKGYVYNQDMWRITVNQKQSLWNLIYFWKIYSKHNDKLSAIEKARQNIILRNQLPRCLKIELSKPKTDGFLRPI